MIFRYHAAIFCCTPEQSNSNGDIVMFSAFGNRCMAHLSWWIDASVSVAYLRNAMTISSSAVSRRLITRPSPPHSRSMLMMRFMMSDPFPRFVFLSAAWISAG